MKLNEFTSAEEQLALWKLVSDNVWQAISTQAEEERRAKAEKTAQAKAKRGVNKRGGRKSATLSHVPVSFAPNKPYPTAKPTNNPSQSKQQQVVGMTQQHTQTQPLPNPHSPIALPTQHKTATPLPNAQQMDGGTAQQQVQQPAPTQQTQVPLTQQQMRLQRQKIGKTGRSYTL